jgi:AraC family L-rhamnose operon regulatory protein RhaS
VPALLLGTHAIRNEVLMFAARASRPVKPEFPPWGIFVLESHHAKDFRMPTMAHDFLKIMFVLGGQGAVTSKSADYPLRKNDVIVVSAGFAHRIEDDANRALSLIVLCVKRPVLELLPGAAPSFPICRVYRNHALAVETRRTLRQLFFEQSMRRSSCAMMITGLTLQLLASLLRIQSARVDRSETYAERTPLETRVRAYIKELETRFQENEKIDNVASRLGMSRRYFTRLFRELTGNSWLDHVRDLRLEHAKLLLRKTDRSILPIAFECGFDDLSSFYRAFKSEVGVTPQQWRSR